MKEIITGPEVIRWVEQRIHSSFPGATALGLVENGQLIAGVVYNDFNGANINMHVAAVGKRWMTKQFLWSCFHYPFELLKVKRVTGLVGEGNKEARRFDEHLGFKLEASLRDCHPTGRLFVYRMLRSECRFLTLKESNMATTRHQDAPTGAPMRVDHEEMAA